MISVFVFALKIKALSAAMFTSAKDNDAMFRQIFGTLELKLKSLEPHIKSFAEFGRDFDRPHEFKMLKEIMEKCANLLFDRDNFRSDRVFRKAHYDVIMMGASGSDFDDIVDTYVFEEIRYSKEFHKLKESISKIRALVQTCRISQEEPYPGK